ncbi:DMT family transporter [Thalassobaculum salexigens]|uniref:DMT family transporter n=1 Tax=Thalassobaculum salexigens TaxID=455360 RepID=UPI00040B0F4F|nr:DMT family transporter [Thalassobaculum salexigens]
MLTALIFAIMLALFKWLGQSLPTTQLLLLRQLGVMAILVPAMVQSRGEVLRAERPSLNLFRGLLSAGSMLLGFTAVVHLSLAESTTLHFTKVFFVVLLGGLLLRERMTVTRWGAMALGFAGVAVVLAPSASSMVDPMAVFAVLAAAMTAGTMLVVRTLAQVERTSTMMIWQSAVVLAVVAIPGTTGWIMPSLEQWGWIALLCLLMGAAQWTMIRAHRSAEASALSPLEYTRLLYAAAFGFLIFDHVPEGNTLLGAILIVAAAIWVRRDARAAPVEDEDDISDPAERR